MVLYRYEATDQAGALIQGEHDASSREEMFEYLVRKNLVPVIIKQKEDVEKKSTLRTLGFFNRISPLDRIVLVRNLAATVRAGLSILEALDILITDATKKTMKEILMQAKINLQNGQSLSFTFNSFRSQFPPVFVGMVRAGELSGRLDTTLEELGRHLDREYTLTRKVKSALAYPVLLLVASTGIASLLLFFVLPRLAKTFTQSGVELPFITRVLIGASQAVIYSPILDIFVVAIIVWFFTRFRQTPAGQRFFAMILFRMPIARDLTKKVALVRLTRTLGSLIGSGVPIVEGLTLTSDAVGNVYYKHSLETAIAQIKNGIPLSKSLSAYPELYPRFLTSLVVVGERTGTLEHILKTFAEFYDSEVDNTLKNLTSYLEPLLLLVMGLVVGSIVLSILLPIYQLVGTFT